jgi:dTDP-4-dehydrorhamnose 3,5-epimerase
MINDLIISPLEIIDTPGGDVLHAMKKKDKGFEGFGEAYFSEVQFNSIKAWKRHIRMTLNIIVPFGKIKFVLFDDRLNSNIKFQEMIISKNTYVRLTVPPMIWVGFQGLSPEGSILLNIANIEHDPDEVDRKKITEINYDWSNSK